MTTCPAAQLHRCLSNRRLGWCLRLPGSVTGGRRTGQRRREPRCSSRASVNLHRSRRIVSSKPQMLLNSGNHYPRVEGWPGYIVVVRQLACAPFFPIVLPSNKPKLHFGLVYASLSAKCCIDTARNCGYNRLCIIRILLVVNQNKQ
jgi:hypothetical protein